MVCAMRILRMTLVTLLLGLSACVVKGAAGAGTMPPPSEGPPPPAHEGGANLHGSVVDASTHQPIMKAAIDVAVENVGKYTQQTGADGTFDLRDIPPGDYKLRVRREGYQPWMSGVVTLRPGDNPPLDVALTKK